MNFKRRLLRANKEPHCCGQKMIRKESYDTETGQFYFCEKCGREKMIPSTNSR